MTCPRSVHGFQASGSSRHSLLPTPCRGWPRCLLSLPALASWPALLPPRDVSTKQGRNSNTYGSSRASSRICNFGSSKLLASRSFPSRTKVTPITTSRTVRLAAPLLHMQEHYAALAKPTVAKPDNQCRETARLIGARQLTRKDERDTP